MNSLAILGASGHGKVAADIAEQVGFSKIDFFDDQVVGSIGTWRIIGMGKDLLKNLPAYSAIFIAIGKNEIRQKLYDQFSAAGGKLTTLTHPSAIISRHALIGEASIIAANAVVNPFSKIGKGVILNTSATIDHDCIIEDFAHISPGANLAGGVSIGARSWVGIGASIKQNIAIGQDVVVGAGASVVQNIPNNWIVAGVPAAELKKR